jgi:hypothetical protein
LISVLADRQITKAQNIRNITARTGHSGQDIQDRTAGIAESQNDIRDRRGEEDLRDSYSGRTVIVRYKKDSQNITGQDYEIGQPW